MSRAGVHLTMTELQALEAVVPHLPEVDEDAEFDGVCGVVEEILTVRLAAPFRCETHMCGSCGGCKAAKVRDLVTESMQREGRVLGVSLWMQQRLARSSDWTTEDYDDLCDGVVRRLTAALAPTTDPEETTA